MITTVHCTLAFGVVTRLLFSIHRQYYANASLSFGGSIIFQLLFCWKRHSVFCFFFFQAEDGIRDLTVTGVQTCALPIYLWRARRRARPAALRETDRAQGGCIAGLGWSPPRQPDASLDRHVRDAADHRAEIGRASCRERV